MGKNTWNVPSNNAWIILACTCYFYLKILRFFSPLKCHLFLQLSHSHMYKTKPWWSWDYCRCFLGVLSWEEKGGLEIRAGFPPSHILGKKGVDADRGKGFWEPTTRVLILKNVKQFPGAARHMQPPEVLPEFPNKQGKLFQTKTGINLSRLPPCVICPLLRLTPDPRSSSSRSSC